MCNYCIDSTINNSNIYSMNTALELKIMRIRTGVSQKALAATIGVGKNYLCGVENGRSKLYQCLHDKIVNALNKVDDSR